MEIKLALGSGPLRNSNRTEPAYSCVNFAEIPSRSATTCRQVCCYNKVLGQMRDIVGCPWRIVRLIARESDRVNV